MRKKIELYEDKKGEYRWRLISSGRVIAESGEGYTKKSSAKAAVKSVVRAITGGTMEDPSVPVIDLTMNIRVSE
jgi:uncharacterized protein YegP (UPF0339 family)